jgi:hypothetical protein
MRYDTTRHNAGGAFPNGRGAARKCVSYLVRYIKPPLKDRLPKLYTYFRLKSYAFFYTTS